MFAFNLWSISCMCLFRVRPSGWCCELSKNLFTTREMEAYPYEEPYLTWLQILRSLSTFKMCKWGKYVGAHCLIKQEQQKSTQQFCIYWYIHTHILAICGWFGFLFVFYYSYREKAMQDAAAVSKHVESLLQSVGKVWHKAVESV